jgi:hypothetical protein
MNALAKILAPLALGATLLSPVLYALHLLGESPLKLILLAATVLWFATAPFWLKGGGQ